MEVGCPSETLASYKATCNHNPDDHNVDITVVKISCELKFPQ
jgi:hypothetical protein